MSSTLPCHRGETLIFLVEGNLSLTCLVWVINKMKWGCEHETAYDLDVFLIFLFRLAVCLFLGRFFESDIM